VRKLSTPPPNTPLLTFVITATASNDSASNDGEKLFNVTAEPASIDNVISVDTTNESAYNTSVTIFNAADKHASYNHVIPAAAAYEHASNAGVKISFAAVEPRGRHKKFYTTINRFISSYVSDSAATQPSTASGPGSLRAQAVSPFYFASPAVAAISSPCSSLPPWLLLIKPSAVPTKLCSPPARPCSLIFAQANLVHLAGHSRRLRGKSERYCSTRER
jgi:hypothetical protein